MIFKIDNKELGYYTRVFGSPQLYNHDSDFAQLIKYVTISKEDVNASNLAASIKHMLRITTLIDDNLAEYDYEEIYMLANDGMYLRVINGLFELYNELNSGDLDDYQGVNVWATMQYLLALGDEAGITWEEVREQLNILMQDGIKQYEKENDNVN